MSDFADVTFGGAPFSALELGAYQVFLTLNLIFTNVDFVFYGEVGDVIILPPDIIIPPPPNMNERRSPCLVFANEDM